MTARIRSILRRDYPMTAARVHEVETGGNRWAAYDIDNRLIAWGSIIGDVVVLYGVA